MDTELYIAMNGANSAMQQQQISANNLANANTPGFLADLYTAQSYVVNGSQVNSAAVTGNATTVPDFAPGSLISTGRELDIAIKGEGLIAIQMEDGREGYTRAGNFQISSSGQLTSGSGRPVLGNGGPIAIPPAAKVEIGSDGTISILPVGQEAAALATLDRIKLVNPNKADLEKHESGLLMLKNGGEAEADGNVQVVSGAIIGSNVNSASTMIDMIGAARQFEMSMRMVKEYSQNTQATAQLLQLP